MQRNSSSHSVQSKSLLHPTCWTAAAIAGTANRACQSRRLGVKDVGKLPSSSMVTSTGASTRGSNLSLVGLCDTGLKDVGTLASSSMGMSLGASTRGSNLNEVDHCGTGLFATQRPFILNTSTTNPSGAHKEAVSMPTGRQRNFPVPASGGPTEDAEATSMELAMPVPSEEALKRAGHGKASGMTDTSDGIRINGTSPKVRLSCLPDRLRSIVGLGGLEPATEAWSCCCQANCDWILMRLLCTRACPCSNWSSFLSVAR
mmetsp:Transcript_120644/g.385177  ORF Transcript_120644/g.385177 Transcript_120644/m.385177 type:complete len:259 (+) Transcript_120644:64-840(+)